jgi:hypothetical protein
VLFYPPDPGSGSGINHPGTATPGHDIIVFFWGGGSRVKLLFLGGQE